MSAPGERHSKRRAQENGERVITVPENICLFMDFF